MSVAKGVPKYEGKMNGFETMMTWNKDGDLGLVRCSLYSYCMSHRSPSGEWCEIFAIDIHTGLRKLKNGVRCHKRKDRYLQHKHMLFSVS